MNTEDTATIPIHMYTSRKFKSDEFKKLCDGQWAKSEKYNKMGPWHTPRPAGYVTVAANVTCKECLKLLIPKKEAELEKMRANFEAAQ